MKSDRPYGKVTTIDEIARYLNLPLDVARALADEAVFPGAPTEGGWLTTTADLEQWYNGLSGVQWAQLVSHGDVDRLTVQLELSRPVSESTFQAQISAWEQQGVATISSPLRRVSATDLQVVLELRGIANRGREDQGAFDSIQVPAIREDLSVVARCHIILGESSVIVTLRAGRNLDLSLDDQKEDLPQREREIVRALLACHVSRLANQLEEQASH